MQTDLHHFLSRLAGAIAMSLVPVLLTAFLTMPSALQRHAMDRPLDPHVPMEHMT